MTGRGDIAVSRVHDLRNEMKYASIRRLAPEQVIKQVIKREKELCNRSIFLAIELNNLIDYNVEVDYATMTLKTTARLRECVSLEKLKEIEERKLSTDKNQDNDKSN